MLHHRSCQNRALHDATPQKLQEQGTSGCYTTEAARTGHFRMLHHRSCQNRALQDATPQKLPLRVSSGCNAAENATIVLWNMKYILIVIHVRALMNSSYNKTNKCTNVKIIFLHRNFINLACFDLFWSSSGSYWTSIEVYKTEMDY